jgi:hypothetical protein
MKRLFFTIAFIVIGLISFAQVDSGRKASNFAPIDAPAPYTHKGILAGVGTVGIGQMPALNISNAYVTGNIEYYTRRNVSIRGDGFFFVNSLTQGSPLVKNSGVYFGAFYHFPVYGTVGRYFDPLIGFQPGWSLTKMVAPDFLGNPAIYYDAATLCPLASIVTGFNFWGEKWFHIQFNVRYTFAQYLAPSSQVGVLADQYNTSELSFNFGLGFNIDVIPQKDRRFEGLKTPDF